MQAPQMDRHGRRIYCHDMDEDQQKWAIDNLGCQISLTIPSTIGLLIADVVVKSCMDDKAILSIKHIRTPTDEELRSIRRPKDE